MSESHFDSYEHYNYDQEKYIQAGKSGKQRTKKEAELHTNHTDPSGQTRKILTKVRAFLYFLSHLVQTTG